MTSVDHRPENPDVDEAPAEAVRSAIPPGTVFRWAAAAALGVAVVVFGIFALYTVRQVLVQVMIALFVAVSLDPAVRWLIKRGIRRSVAVTIIFALVLLVLVAFVWALGPPLVRQATNLAADLPGYVEDLPEKSRAYREFADRYGLTQRITEWAGSLPGKIGGDALGFVQRFLGAVLNVLLVIVLTIYFMLDLPRLRRGLVRLFPRERRPKVAQAVNVVVDKVGGYMIGNLIISLFAGVSTFVALWALDVPFALPLALFVAVTDLIPLIGATLGAAGCMLVTLATVDLWPNAALVALFFVLYQQIENYLIAPRVLKNTVDLSSVTVLLAALIGGTVLGVVGALMSIPIVAAIKVLMTPVVDALNEPQANHPEPPALPPVSPAAPAGPSATS